jgi:hypothetical protein
MATEMRIEMEDGVNKGVTEMANRMGMSKRKYVERVIKMDCIRRGTLEPTELDKELGMVR